MANFTILAVFLPKSKEGNKAQIVKLIWCMISYIYGTCDARLINNTSKRPLRWATENIYNSDVYVRFKKKH